jgi:mevalonate kinase
MQASKVVASVPGKLILMGEHAAVYYRPALVAAVGLRAQVELEPGDRGVEIDLPDLDHREHLDWRAVLAQTRAARRAWSRYAEQPGPESFESVQLEDPAHLVKVALGEVVDDLGLEEPPPVVLKISSELPIGGGFGSSAAVGVGVVAGLLRFLGDDSPVQRIDRLALAVERRQHGLPSGVDHRTVLTGGILWACRRPDESVMVESLDPDARFLSQLGVFDSGQPRESTGSVVATVRRRKEGRPEHFSELLDRMERDVGEFRELLTMGEARPEQAVALIRDYENCLEEMGVVPEAVQRVIRRVEEKGGAAKISGAGSLSGTGAGCLLVYPVAGDGPKMTEELPEYRRHRCTLGVEGLRVEVVH